MVQFFGVIAFLLAISFTPNSAERWCVSTYEIQEDARHTIDSGIAGWEKLNRRPHPLTKEQIEDLKRNYAQSLVDVLSQVYFISDEWCLFGGPGYWS